MSWKWFEMQRNTIQTSHRPSRHCAFAVFFLSLLALLNSPIRADDVWKKIDGVWEGGSTAVIWKMVVWPGKDLVIASTRSNGLWSSSDGGENWKRMGQPGKTPSNAGQAVTFVFDPTDPKTMWTAGMYNYGVWKTSDAGQTFTHLGKNDHCDGIAVDFADPLRKTLLLGLHEQEHSLHRSTDGGLTWERIGDKIPEGTAFTTDPIIIDSKTYVINSSGYKKGEAWGIYRTEDAGQTWAQVSKEGAGGNYTFTSKGQIFWSCLWDQHMITSTDQGKTWSRVRGPARGRIIEVVPDTLIALGGSNKTRFFFSKDNAQTWTPFGPVVPFKGHDVAYDPIRKCLYVWKDIDTSPVIRPPGTIARWDLPPNIESAFAIH